MSGNLPGTRSYAIPDAERLSPRKSVAAPAAFWLELDAEALRRGFSRSELLREAARAYLPTSREMPEKST